MTEFEYRQFIEKQRMMGLLHIRREARRIARQLGLGLIWDRMDWDRDFQRDLSNWRARYALGIPVTNPPSWSMNATTA